MNLIGSNFKLLISLMLSVLAFTGTKAASHTQDVWDLEWTDAGDSTDFILRTKLATGNNVWTAFALSKDKKMVSDLNLLFIDLILSIRQI